MEMRSLVRRILPKVGFSGDNMQLSPHHLHLLQKQIELFSNVQTGGKKLSTLWLIFHCQSVELHHSQCQQNKHVHMVIKQRDADHKLKVAKCKQAASLYWCWSPCPWSHHLFGVLSISAPPSYHQTLLSMFSTIVQWSTTYWMNHCKNHLACHSQSIWDHRIAVTNWHATPLLSSAPDTGSR